MTDRVFDYLDDDFSGSLDVDEIGKVMNRVAGEMGVRAPSDEDLKTIFSVID